jgi:hypothetical protein
MDDCADFLPITLKS